MGKIYDALEKANKQTISKINLTPSKRQKSKEKTSRRTTNNVVSLASTKEQIIQRGFDQNLITFHAPQSPEAGIFKKLRTNLLFPAKGQRPKIIMVTSAMPEDGKSFVSSNLAVSMAQSVEEHVLLIDTDLRNSSLNGIFGMKMVKGLSDFLDKGSNVADYFTKTKVRKLTLLTAGHSSKNPTELLTTNKMKEMLKEVSDRYQDRYIVIDSAPPSIASETVAIANYVDGILLVVRSGKTPKKSIEETIKILGKEKILGIVFNDSEYFNKKYYSYGK